MTVSSARIGVNRDDQRKAQQSLVSHRAFTKAPTRGPLCPTCETATVTFFDVEHLGVRYDFFPRGRARIPTVKVPEVRKEGAGTWPHVKTSP
eukprot:4780396-Prymnesium_polylepis.1